MAKNVVAVFLALAGSFATIAVTPWYNYDPINYIKLFFLSTLSLSAIVYVFLSRSTYLIKSHSEVVFAGLILFFIIILIAPVSLRSNPLQTQFWGAWGRATGILAFISLSILMFVSSYVNNNFGLRVVTTVFMRTSYFISIYTTLQFADLDPIPWSQKLPVATLGNINFMSAFLGLANIIILGKFFVEKLQISQKIFFVLVLAWNNYLLISTGSIQGALLFIMGTLVLLAFRYNFFTAKLITRILIVFGLSTIGIIIFIGGMGLGPLGKFLLQDTLLFRIDYWSAGLNMTLSNPILGLGIDGYGNNYREYRNLIAAERTGPQRVTNTAHNIFLDISSGGGIPLLVALLLLYGFISYIGFRNIRKGILIEYSVPIFALWIGFLGFHIISINQLGVAVWGWIFGGLVIAINRIQLGEGEPNSTWEKNNGKISKGKKLNRFEHLSLGEKALGRKLSTFHRAIVLLSAVLGGSLAAPPLIADGRFLQAYRNADSSAMVSLAQSWTYNELMVEKTISFFVEQNKATEALSFVRWAVVKNPKDTFAWNILRLHVSSTEEERLKAIEVLKVLDPMNMPFLKELEEQESQLRG